MSPDEQLLLSQLLFELMRLRRAVTDLTDQVQPTIGERSLTIGEFCSAEAILRAFLNKMRAAGRGPREMRLSDDCVRFSPEARRQWHERLEAASVASKPTNNNEKARQRPHSAAAPEVQPARSPRFPEGP